MMDEASIKRSFIAAAAGADLSIIEGVRGLYEGASPTSDEGSTVHLAKILRSPVVVVLNCQSLTRSAAAMVLGLKAMDREADIAGIILNKVSDKRHEEKLRAAISYYTSTPIIGAIYRDSSLILPKRHLGLLTVQENYDVMKVIKSMGLILEECLDIEMLLKIMHAAPELEVPNEGTDDHIRFPGIRIGVFMDPVFTFYYPENLESLKRFGVEILFINSLADHSLGDISGLIIGGGYPEVFATELEGNQPLRTSVKKASSDGMPVIGECGGLLYLSKSITIGKSKWSMVGALDGEAVMCESPQALSYTALQSSCSNPIADQGDIVRGHEFHYSRLEGIGDARFAFKVLRGKGINGSMDGIMSYNTLGTYTHFHCLAYPKMPLNLIKSCVAYNRR